jgi:hypothetical protein
MGVWGRGLTMTSPPVPFVLPKSRVQCPVINVLRLGFMRQFLRERGYVWICVGRRSARVHAKAQTVRTRSQVEDTRIISSGSEAIGFVRLVQVYSFDGRGCDSEVPAGSIYIDNALCAAVSRLCVNI